MATDITPPPPTSKPSLEPHSSTIQPIKTPEPDSDVIHIPTYSRWFYWNAIHECETRFVPEFFDSKSPSKNRKTYKYYRNSIIARFRENPTRKLTFTEVRKNLVGDVGSIRRVFDFLETWGLINYTGGSKQHQNQLKWEDKETKSAPDANPVEVPVPKKLLCSECKAVCTIACFSSDKHDMTLCARCYVRNNYRMGMSSTDFKRVEISEEAKTDWCDKNMVHLLEAVIHCGDDWNRIAEHVGGRSVKECVARFIKLPFAEQFRGPPESAEVDVELGVGSVKNVTKKQCLSPLADASNPIMAQAAFLSTLVGVDVAQVAARAAVTSLSDVGDAKRQKNLKTPPNTAKQPELDNVSNVSNLDSIDRIFVEVDSQLVKEENELEKAITGITDETKGIQEKIVLFEEFEVQIEKKWQQVQQLQDSLFADKLSLLFHNNKADDATKIVENKGEASRSGSCLHI